MKIVVAEKSKKSNAGAIAGAVIGTVFGVAIIAAIAFVLYRRYRKKRIDDGFAIELLPVPRE